MKRFAAEIEEMSYGKVFITPNGPIDRNTNGRKFVYPINESKNVENQQEMMEIDTPNEMYQRLDDASCNFLKKPGQIYHLYVNCSGKKYFSMISPEEWGTPPHEYIGSWKLEQNSTWTNTILKRS